MSEITTQSDLRLARAGVSDHSGSDPMCALSALALASEIDSIRRQNKQLIASWRKALA